MAVVAGGCCSSGRDLDDQSTSEEQYQVDDGGRRRAKSRQQSAGIDPIPADPLTTSNTPDSPTDGLAARAEVLLREEFNQAWAHYRQAETTRTQLLTVCLTVSAAACAVGSQVAARSDLTDPKTLVAFSGSLFAFTLFTAFIYVAVRKTDAVLMHYERVLNLVRDYFYVGVNREIEPYKSLSIRNFKHPMLGTSGWWRFTRIQTAVENIVMGIAVLATGGQIGLMIAALTAHSPNWLAVAIQTVLLVASLVVTAGLVSLRIATNRARITELTDPPPYSPVVTPSTQQPPP